MMACQEKKAFDLLIFKYNQADNVNSLDPAFAKAQNNIWAVNQLFDGLVHFEDNKIEPRIAKSWIINDEGTQLTFIIDKSFIFHESSCFSSSYERVVSADDVVFSFERIISDTLNSPGSWIFKDIVSSENPFVAVNDSIFQINLKSPFVPILGILSMQYCSIVSRKAVDYYGRNFRKHPIGTGPFKMKRWQENHALFLSKNTDYPYIKHNIDGIKISFIPDKKIAFYEFMNGKLDLISGVESAYANELLDKQGELLPNLEGDIKYFTSPFLNLEYIGINQDALNNSILKKKEFRQALNLSIDRNEMLKLFKNGIGEAALAGVIPKGLDGHHEEFNYTSFKPDEAKQIINSFIKSGLSMPNLTIKTNQDYVDVISYVAKSWENLGLQVDIELMDAAILRQQMRNGQASIFRASWIADYLDEQSFLCLFYGQNPAPPNYSRFNDPEFDKYYELAISESDYLKRQKLYKSLDSIVVTKLPIIPLYYDETALFVSSRVKSGISSNPLNVLDLRKIQMQKIN
jgi:peptide/nickel transport system substrate-binding protein